MINYGEWKFYKNDSAKDKVQDLNLKQLKLKVNDAQKNMKKYFKKF